jgi:hypothetical protein
MTRSSAMHRDALTWKERDQYDREYEELKEEKLYAPLRRGELTPDAWIEWCRAAHALRTEWFSGWPEFDEQGARTEYKQMHEYWSERAGDSSPEEREIAKEHRQEWTGEFSKSALEAREDRALLQIRAAQEDAGAATD